MVSGRLQMHDRFLVLTTLLIAPLVAGCAQIKSFSVAPSIVCPGETVEIDWKASDKITLDAAPPWRGQGKEPSEGSHSFAPTENSDFDQGSGPAQECSARVGCPGDTRPK